MSNAALAGEVGTEPRPTGFFEQEWPANLILGSFYFVTLPVVLLAALMPLSGLLVMLYLWLFGMTHFMLTLTIYLNRANLSYFNRTWPNRLLYFVLPLAIFVIYDLIHATRAWESFPLIVLTFRAATRLFDFNHFTRQTFGVLMLFKSREGITYPRDLKRYEVTYFNLLTLLLFVTFLSGGLLPLLQAGGPLSLQEWKPPLEIFRILPVPVAQFASLFLLLAVGGLFVRLAAQYRKARREAGRAGGDKPVMYLTYQTLGGLLAAVSIPLYVATLALHYVEYHVLMIPRCFHLPLDESSRVDRAFLWMRRSALRFYTILLALAGVATFCLVQGMGAMGITEIEPGATFGYLALIALFDGLFVFHYLVETFIWRFSNPYYRKQLASLYFAPKPAPPRSVPVG